MPTPSIIRLGQLGKGVRDHGMFLAGWCAIPLLGPLISPALVEYTMDCVESVGKWEVVEGDLVWENPGVALVNIRKNTRSWIHDREV